MSLDLRHFHFEHIIVECLNIESFEDCYFIPVLAQTAEYWGDAQVASTCNLMSQQVKKYFNHAAHVHFYISKKNEYLNHNISMHDKYYQFANTVKSEIQQTNYNSYLSKNYKLYHPNDINKTLYPSNETYIFLSTYEKEKNILLQSLNEIDQNLLDILAKLGEKLEDFQITEHLQRSSFSSHGQILDRADCFLLLKNLGHRKIWKCNRWYPLVSKLASDQKMFHISRTFMQISKSEQSVSRLLAQFMHR